MKGPVLQGQKAGFPIRGHARLVGVLISGMKFLEYFSRPVLSVSQGGDTFLNLSFPIIQCSVASLPGCCGEWDCGKHQKQRLVLI